MIIIIIIIIIIIKCRPKRNWLKWIGFRAWQEGSSEEREEFGIWSPKEPQQPLASNSLGQRGLQSEIQILD
jgi:hypothetical protein